jgi:DNA damage-binding protein 2
MVFNPDQPFHMYVTSLDGTFSMKDLNNKHTEVYNDTMDLRYWWTSVALSSSIVFVGGNTGKALVLNKEGKTLFTYPHFHKDKVHHAEFSPIQDHVLVTSSNDKTVALWDMRMLSESPQPNKIVTIKQEAPITSVYFDPLYGSSLLTTSQNNEIRVYHSYNYENPALVLKHPHRNFQHMTHIKATWHPLYEDICIIGRYADADDPDKTRCVDIVNLKESAVVGQFYDPSAKQIMTVCLSITPSSFE